MHEIPSDPEIIKLIQKHVTLIPPQCSHALVSAHKPDPENILRDKIYCRFIAHAADDDDDDDDEIVLKWFEMKWMHTDTQISEKMTYALQHKVKTSSNIYLRLIQFAFCRKASMYKRALVSHTGFCMAVDFFYSHTARFGLLCVCLWVW